MTASKRLRPTSPPRCGEMRGWRAHKKRGEDPCPPCAAAAVVYRREHRKPGPPSTRVLRPCGTYAAAQRHTAHGEELDPACKAALRRYKTDHAAAARATAAVEAAVWGMAA